MTSFVQSTFAISQKPNFEFLQHQIDSDSEREEEKKRFQEQQDHQRDHKKFKKLIDVDLIKAELIKRPFVEEKEQTSQKRKLSKIKSVRSLSDLIIPSSPILVDQLTHLKKIKEIRAEVPPELMGRIFSELRYEFVPALNPVYRQGDQNKKFYIVLDGKCVVMKPKQKMVGSSKIEMDENLKAQTERKTDDDPLGLKSLFPEYLILKILFQGDSFGEAAIKLDTARSSTIYTLEDSHLLYLSESAYLEYLNPYLSGALDKKLKFFEHTPLFQNIDPQDYMGIVLESKQITLKAGETIYDEGEKTKFIYFIVSGEIELIKQIKKKSIILSSYGEYQQFGEVEIMMKINRYTKAKVISPRLICLRIRKKMFFDNLGSYGTYENMKKHAGVIYKHWQLIGNAVQKQINPRDEVFEAAYDDQANKPNLMAKNILNKKLVESQGQKLSQVKVFQNLQDQNLKDLKYLSSDNQNMLQRVYSNTLQQYQAKLLKHPQAIICEQDNNCIRNQKNNQQTNNQQTNTSFNNEINTTISPLNENSIDLNLNSNQSSHMIPKIASSKTTLPSISHSLHVVGPQPQSLNSVLESISKLPRVPKDNLVLSLMYQQAYKAENPQKKAKEIQQVIQASYRNVQNRFQPKKHHLTEIQPLSNDHRAKKTIILAELEGVKRKHPKYLSFVQQKKIFPGNQID